MSNDSTPATIHLPGYVKMLKKVLGKVNSFAEQLQNEIDQGSQPIRETVSLTDLHMMQSRLLFRSALFKARDRARRQILARVLAKFCDGEDINKQVIVPLFDYTCVMLERRTLEISQLDRHTSFLKKGESEISWGGIFSSLTSAGTTLVDQRWEANMELFTRFAVQTYKETSALLTRLASRELVLRREWGSAEAGDPECYALAAEICVQSSALGTVAVVMMTYRVEGLSEFVNKNWVW